jgi:polar amino acid transport system substrate-binding protein
MIVRLLSLLCFGIFVMLPPIASAQADVRTSLAPAGKVRVAFLVAPVFATRNAATGEFQGVAVELGKSISSRIGVPLELVSYTTLPDLVAGISKGEADIFVTGINSERAALVDFSPAIMQVEQGFLARQGAAGGLSAADIDRANLRIGVLEKSGSDRVLSQSIKSASIHRVATIAELLAVLDSAKVDVIAGTKTTLFSAAEQRQGTRMLDGYILLEPIGFGVPKGRDPVAASFLKDFVEKARTDGTIKSAIESAKLRGVSIPGN